MNNINEIKSMDVLQGKSIKDPELNKIFGGKSKEVDAFCASISKYSNNGFIINF